MEQQNRLYSARKNLFIRFCFFFGIGTLPHVKGKKEHIFVICSWDVKLIYNNIGAALITGASLCEEIAI